MMIDLKGVAFLDEEYKVIIASPRAVTERSRIMSLLCNAQYICIANEEALNNFKILLGNYDAESVEKFVKPGVYTFIFTGSMLNLGGWTNFEDLISYARDSINAVGLAIAKNERLPLSSEEDIL